MPTTQRRRKTKRLSKRRGGQLVVTPTNLIDNHMCGKKTDKETTGHEVFTAVDQPLPVTEETLNTFFSNFKKADNNWFKFVIFNNDGKLFIYVVKGNEINKHSVAFLHGLLDVTRPDEYTDLRTAYNDLLEIKSLNNISLAQIEEKVQHLNKMIKMYVPCSPVVVAGSGTINSDSICLNTKSGHYKPTLENIKVAKAVFESVTKMPVNIQDKVDKNALLKKYGNSVKDFAGICL